MESHEDFSDPAKTCQEVVQQYREWRQTYEEVSLISKYTGFDVAAKTVMEYCPGNPSSVAVLDVGAGTGLVGKGLQNMGFQKIDGVDPSEESLKVARDKGVYRHLYCSFFTKQPLDIERDSYDVIVTTGTFLNGHLPYDCINEMARLVKPGGKICIVARASSFDNKTVPAYVDKLVPLMCDFEKSGKWKKITWETFSGYRMNNDGCKIVYEIL